MRLHSWRVASIGRAGNCVAAGGRLGAARLRHRLRPTPPGPPFARGGKACGVLPLARGGSSELACARCTALLTALVSGQGGRADRASVNKRLARSRALVAAADAELDWISGQSTAFPFDRAASDEAAPCISSGSQQLTRAIAGDLAERTRLLTERGAAPAVRGVGREAPRNRATRTRASHVCLASPRNPVQRVGVWLLHSASFMRVRTGRLPRR